MFQAKSKKINKQLGSPVHIEKDKLINGQTLFCKQRFYESYQKIRGIKQMWLWSCLKRLL